MTRNALGTPVIQPTQKYYRIYSIPVLDFINSRSQEASYVYLPVMKTWVPITVSRVWMDIRLLMKMCIAMNTRLRGIIMIYFAKVVNTRTRDYEYQWDMDTYANQRWCRCCTEDTPWSIVYWRWIWQADLVTVPVSIANLMILSIAISVLWIDYFISVEYPWVLNNIKYQYLLLPLRDYPDETMIMSLQISPRNIPRWASNTGWQWLSHRT